MLFRTERWRCIHCVAYFRLILILGFLLSWLLLVQFWNRTAQPLFAQRAPEPHTPANQCRTCHQGIEPIRDYQSKMMKEILKVAALAGYPGNDCIVCHGGQPNGKTFAEIHSGTVDYFRTHPGPKDFYPDPGSPWINVHTCGPCHRELVRTQWTSLMMTEAGKSRASSGDSVHSQATTINTPTMLSIPCPTASNWVPPPTKHICSV